MAVAPFANAAGNADRGVCFCGVDIHVIGIDQGGRMLDLATQPDGVAARRYAIGPA